MLREKIENYAERMSALESEAKEILTEIFKDDEVKEIMLNLSDDNFDDFVDLIIKAVSDKGVLKEAVEITEMYARSIIDKR
jgi:hypothetical protein